MTTIQIYRDSSQLVVPLSLKAGSILTINRTFDPDSIILLDQNNDAIPFVLNTELTPTGIQANTIRLLKSSIGWVHLSYNITDLHWTPDITALIVNNKGKSEIKVLLGAKIYNTDQPLAGNISLAVSEMAKTASTQYRMESRSIALPPSALTLNTNDRKVAGWTPDLVYYNLGTQVIPQTINGYTSLNLNTFEVEAKKLYYASTNDQKTVKYGYRFVTPIYLPASTIRVHGLVEPSSDLVATNSPRWSGNRLLGELDIPETQTTQIVDMEVGNTDKLVVRPMVTNTTIEVEGKQYHQQQIECKIDTNGGSCGCGAQTLVIRHRYLNDNFTCTCTYRHVPSRPGLIEFSLSVEPGEHAILNCNLTYATPITSK